MAIKRVITRSEAERLIGEYQREMLRRYGCSSTWELYADFGASHCCGGIFRLRDEELRQIYYRLIPGIEKMSREGMLDAIIQYERTEVGGEGFITCQDVARRSRVCDGLDRYTNTELAVWFPQVLGDAEVVDDPLPQGQVPSRRGLVFFALSIAVLLLMAFLLLAFLWQ